MAEDPQIALDKKIKELQEFIEPLRVFNFSALCNRIGQLGEEMRICTNLAIGKALREQDEEVEE